MKPGSASENSGELTHHHDITNSSTNNSNNQQHHHHSNNSNTNVLDVGGINSELEANLVSIAAAAARPHDSNNNHNTNTANTSNHNINANNDDTSGIVDPQIQLETGSNNATTTTNQQLLSQTSTDPKKTCPFCTRTFSHPGSLGRHLDLKRGTRLHPAAKVDMMRGDVKRRGDVVEIKARRARRAKLYNSRQDVKERAKARRKHKERSDKAKGIAKSRFINRLGIPQLPPHPTFAYMVLYFLSPYQWPHDPPTRQTYDQLLESLPGGDLRSKAEVAFEQWGVMNMQTKIDIWTREQRRAAEAAIGSITLYDLGARESWLALEENKITGEMAEEAGNANTNSDDEEDDDDEEEMHSNYGDAKQQPQENQHNNNKSSHSHHDSEVAAVAAAVAAAATNHHHHHDVDINANIDEQLFN